MPFSSQSDNDDNNDNNIDNTASTKAKQFAPSRFVLVDNNQKYRLCAAAAVLNSRGDLLVGERTSIKGAWQCPQGGVDAAWKENNHQQETIVQAATRELYEEMGLVLGQHVVLVDKEEKEEEMSHNGIRYETSGTSNWLTKAGFAGQELHWVLFRCRDGRGDAAPEEMVDLSGQNGESPEFNQVAWRPLPQVLDEMWPAKRGPYEALQQLLEDKQVEKSWHDQCQLCTQELAGHWARDATQSQNLVPALIARGMDEAQAQAATEAPYRQHWISKQEKEEDHNNNHPKSLPSWTVVTFATDGKTPRRTLHYPWGEWEETYHGESTLFGASSTPALLKRRTFYAPDLLDSGDDSSNKEVIVVAHVTVSQTPNGDTEEARRYLLDDTKLVLKRTFWSKDSTTSSKGIVSMEVFLRDDK